MLSRQVVEQLLANGKISRFQLDEALRMKGFFGGLVESHLLRLGHIDEPMLAAALSAVSGCPYASAEQLRLIPPEAMSRVPASVLERHRMCPFMLKDRTLSVAMLDPRDRNGISQLQSATGHLVEPWITSEFRLYQALERHYRIRFPGVKAVAPAPPERPSHVRPRPDRPAPEPPPPLDPFGPPEDVERPGGGPVSAWPDTAEAESTSAVASWTGPPREDDEPGSGLDPDDPSEPAFGLASTFDSPASFDEPSEAGRLSAPPPNVDPAFDDRLSPVDDVARLDEALCDAVTRDTIASALLDVGTRFASRGALFAVGRDGIRGVLGRGRGLETATITKVTLEVGIGTVFDTALQSRDFYFGVVPPLSPNRGLYGLIGGELPENVLLLPIKVRDKTVALLYFDNESRPIVEPDIALMLRLAAKAGLAFEIMVLKAKLRAL